MNKRFERALNGEKPDQVPFLPAIYEHKAWFVGETPSRVCRDAHLLTAALLAEYERVQSDALTVGIDIYNVEAEAVGCKVTYYEGQDTSVPTISPAHAVFRGSDDVTSLKLPDPHKDGRMPLFIDVARTIAKILGKEIPVRGALSGPFSLAAHLAGPQALLLLSITQPGIVRDLIGFAAEVIKRYGSAFVEAGCGIVMFDSYASSDLLPPQVYRDLVLGPTKNIVSYFHQMGVRHVPLIIGGNTTSMLDAYLETGANNILCDAKADAKLFLPKCSAQRRAYRRNLDSSRFLEAKPEEIYEQAAKDLEESNRYAGFILGTGVLPYGTPLLHLAAIRHAIQEYKNNGH
jgi:uroporphyrinogen decarboxylase